MIVSRIPIEREIGAAEEYVHEKKGDCPGNKDTAKYFGEDIEFSILTCDKHASVKAKNTKLDECDIKNVDEIESVFKLESKY